MSKQPLRIFIGSAVGRYTEPDHERCMRQLFRHPKVAAGMYVLADGRVYNDALIERSRGRTATAFLENPLGFDVHISIDSDIVFEPDDVFSVCEQAANPKYSIVAGMYVTRSRKAGLCQPTSTLFEGQSIWFANNPTPVEIQWAATGFLATHRRVFEALAKRPDMPLCHANAIIRHYPFYTPFPYAQPRGDTILLSEDYALCERARQEGFKVYLNPAIRLYHLGMVPFGLEDMAHAEAPVNRAHQLTRRDGQHLFETNVPAGRGAAEEAPNSQLPGLVVASR